MSQLVALAGWTFLPGFLSDLALAALHRLFPSRLPVRGTQAYDTLKRAVYAAVVLAYLGYNVYGATAAIGANFYDVLDVPLDADEKTLRSSFRRLSAKYHPDKATGDENKFRAARKAYDTLADGARRFGYDRFGRAAADWGEAKLPIDYLQRGLTAAAPFYVGSAVFIFGLSWLRGDKYGTFWRALLFLALALVHVAAVVGDLRLDALALLLPGSGGRKTAFELVELLKQLTVTAMIAIAQVGPVLFPGTAAQNTAAEVAEVAQLSRVLMVEADQTRQLARLPFLTGTTHDREIIDATVDWMVRARLDAEPEVQGLRNRQLPNGA